MSGRDQLRRQVAELVRSATAGAVPVDRALAGDTPLYDLGVDSLGWLRLIDAIEIAYGLEIDLDGTDLRVATVDSVVDRLGAAGGPTR